MALFASASDVIRVPISSRGSDFYVSQFFGKPHDLTPGPQSHLVESAHPPSTIHPHFHTVDQFQIFLWGAGRLGKHALKPVGIHYTDRFSPYGPIVSDAQGFGFMTVRNAPDAGAQYMPESRREMRTRAGRNLVVEMPVADSGDAGGSTNVCILGPLEDGLAVYRIDIPPHGQVLGPDPTNCGGQQYLVVQGALVVSEKLHPANSMAYVSPTEPALPLVAGSAAVSVLALCFPKRVVVATSP
jgi:hypothetical protein